MYNTMIHTEQQLQWYYFGQTLHSRTTPHISPSRASYGVPFVRSSKKYDSDVSRAHCIYCEYAFADPSTLFFALILQMPRRGWRDSSGSCHQVHMTELHLWRTIHDDVIKWNWPFVRGIHRSPVNSPHKGQWRGALMFSLICAWINGWVNNREAGDLRRHRAYCDVTVMLYTDDAT